jgi:hypothetical protein
LLVVNLGCDVAVEWVMWSLSSSPVALEVSSRCRGRRRVVGHIIVVVIAGGTQDVVVSLRSSSCGGPRCHCHCRCCCDAVLQSISRIPAKATDKQFAMEG